MESSKTGTSVRTYSRNGVTLYNGDVLDLYEDWDSPTAIVSDGAYGVRGFPGDPPTADGLGAWYEPHVAAWTRKSTPQTTLWFWNTELGWANVHPILQQYGWKYVTCHIWDKGLVHAAGNSNTQTLRKFPVVTEVCVQYVKEAQFIVDERPAGMREWVRHEWKRTGLPFRTANLAAGVKDAATRKYFAQDWLFYYPPAEIFEKMVAYANEHGRPEGRPYYSVDGRQPVTRAEWERMRSKFYCEVGVTNVWSEPPMHGEERLKTGTKHIHLNQKPLKLVERIIKASSDPGDLVWEPFGGLCTAAVACFKLGRKCLSAEVLEGYYKLSVERLAGILPKLEEF